METELCPFYGIDCEYIPVAQKVSAYADEIERLKGANMAFAEQVTNDYEEIKRLRKALEIISCKCKSNCGKDEGNCLYWVARCALPQKESE